MRIRMTTLSRTERNLLKGFRRLPEEEKEEILEMLSIKLQKSQKARWTTVRSSRSANGQRHNFSDVIPSGICV